MNDRVFKNAKCIFYLLLVEHCISSVPCFAAPFRTECKCPSRLVVRQRLNSWKVGSDLLHPSWGSHLNALPVWTQRPGTYKIRRVPDYIVLNKWLCLNIYRLLLFVFCFFHSCKWKHFTTIFKITMRKITHVQCNYIFSHEAYSYCLFNCGYSHLRVHCSPEKEQMWHNSIFLCQINLWDPSQRSRISSVHSKKINNWTQNNI